ncbi:MAG: ABC transporter ATP-binding protein [Phycisphaeraceae bacterium]|nr:MAG: ABC transporter ATP-binding protein [Phycisphaeraceae bacterium]
MGEGTGTTHGGPDAALRVEGLRFAYPGAGEDVIAIDELALSAGEQMLLTGGSGRGKSTLLHLVAGLIEPREGRVLVGGRAIHGMRGARRDRFRGREVGMIFQTHHLLAGFSAIENVMVAMKFSGVPRREHRDRAAAALKELGIDRIDADPGALSVGQQQRVAVARAIVCGPKLVLADEPTASLDPAASAVAMDLIQGACRERGAALLCVSHDPAMAGRFERRGELGAMSAATAKAGG